MASLTNANPTNQDIRFAARRVSKWYSWHMPVVCHRCGDWTTRQERFYCRGCGLSVCGFCRAYGRTCVDCGDPTIAISCRPYYQIPISDSHLPRYSELFPEPEYPKLEFTVSQMSDTQIERAWLAFLARA